MEPLTILIVEDNVLTAMDLRDTLVEAGYAVSEPARNLSEALSIAERQRPDLALIDIGLEESATEGITVAQMLINRHRLPVIYLTAHSADALFQAAKATSPAGYLLKPFRSDELKLQIELAWHNAHANAPGDLPAESTAAVDSAIDKLYLPVGKGHEKINPDEVLYLRADGAYVKIYLLDKEVPHHISTNLGRLVPYFSAPNFYRLSRSLLININHIERLEQSHLYMSHHRTPILIPASSRKELLSRLTVVRTK